MLRQVAELCDLPCMRDCSNTLPALEYPISPQHARNIHITPRSSPAKACDTELFRSFVQLDPVQLSVFLLVAVFVQVFADFRALLCISALKAATGEQIGKITLRLFFRGERFLAMSRSSSIGRSGSCELSAANESVEASSVHAPSSDREGGATQTAVTGAR